MENPNPSVAEDFRIGNLINCNGDIRPIDLQDLKNMEEGLDFYKAVPVSEEWLPKFGFEKCRYGWLRNGLLINVSKLSNGEVVGEVEINEYFLCHFDCIHQLQNLFHSINDKELELK